MRWLARFLCDLWLGFIGTYTYASRRDWLRRCVVTRFAWSVGLLGLSLLLALAFGNAANSYGLGRGLMMGCLVGFNVLAGLLFAFGSGRNYGRLEVQLERAANLGDEREQRAAAHSDAVAQPSRRGTLGDDSPDA